MGERDDEDEAGRRAAAGLPARQVLIALLGDYWFHTLEPVPSAALVALLGEFGIGGAGARAALSRLARGGVIEGSRLGRRTAYRFSVATAAEAGALGRLLMSFGREPQVWDGTWTCVAFSFPDEGARSRPALRAGLRRLGMAPLYDGLWVSPHDVSGPAAQVLDGLGATTSTVFRARIPAQAHGRGPIEAWDLDGLREGYERFTTEVAAIATRMRAGRIAAEESLVIRTTVTGSWRRLVLRDPHLPVALLPGAWPVPAAREEFVKVYDGLGPAAEARARAVVAPFDLPDAILPRHHTVGDLL